MEPLPDVASLDDAELKALIERLEAEEDEVSQRRRVLHGQIDLLRAELVERLKKSEGRSVLAEVDIERLSAILAGKATQQA